MLDVRTLKITSVSIWRIKPSSVVRCSRWDPRGSGEGEEGESQGPHSTASAQGQTDSRRGKGRHTHVWYIHTLLITPPPTVTLQQLYYAEMVKYCHNKRMKKFFGYSKYYSVTEMLLALGLSSFDTMINNYRKSFLYVLGKHSNDLVKLLWCVIPSAFCMTYCALSYFFTYSVCLSVYLSVCLCVFVYGPCCLIQIKWWWWWWWW